MKSVFWVVGRDRFAVDAKSILRDYALRPLSTVSIYLSNNAFMINGIVGSIEYTTYYLRLLLRETDNVAHLPPLGT